MDTLFSRHRNAFVLIGVLFVQLVVLAYQVRRPDSEVPLIREWVAMIVTPPQRLLGGVIHGLGSTWTNYIDLRSARRETIALEEELGRQRISNHELREQLREMQRFQALAAFNEIQPSALLPARITLSGGNDQSRVIFLNKGREDGVRPNMAVITPEGVVGKVQRAFEGTSQVLLITDEESGVGALLEKSRIHGVLRGHNSGFCQLRYILNDETVEVGEKVFTSGEDRVFPKGFPVGTVTQVAQASDFKKITVQPAAKLTRLEEVLIVIRGREVVMPSFIAEKAAEKTLPNAKESGLALPAAGAATNPADVSAASAASHTGDKPMIPHGVRPETDADKIRELYRQKALATQKPAVAAPVARPPGAAGATGTTGNPAVTSLAVQKKPVDPNKKPVDPNKPVADPTKPDPTKPAAPVRPPPQ